MLQLSIGRLSKQSSRFTKYCFSSVPSISIINRLGKQYCFQFVNSSKISGWRFLSTTTSMNVRPSSMMRPSQSDVANSEMDLFLTKKPNFAPIPKLSKTDIAKITKTQVGSENLNLTEKDIVEIDSISKQLFDLVNTPFLEETFLELKDMNVDKTFNKIKDTLHIEDLPKAIKAIRVLNAQDRVEDAIFIWNVIKQDPKQCTLFAWTAYLNTLCCHGKSLQAQQEVKEMILQGLLPDCHIFGILVHGLVSEGYLDKAYTVVREMTEQGIKPNNVVISSLLYGCIQKHQVQRACETFDLMRNYIEEADSISLALMIKVSELQHNTEKAIQFFNSLDIHHLPITQGCYHAIMHACATSWRYDVKTFEYFDKMVNAGIKPTLTSFHIQLEACSKHGDFLKVNDIFKQIYYNDLEPNATTFSLALRALAEGCEKGLVMPEHPAGDRRMTRKEYQKFLQGYEKPEPRDRLSYVRDLRSKNVDDGLGDLEDIDEESQQQQPSLPTKADVQAFLTEEAEKLQTSQDLESTLKTNMENMIRTRTDGLSEKEIQAEMDIINGKDQNPSNLQQQSQKSLQDVVNEIVKSDYTVLNEDKKEDGLKDPKQYAIELMAINEKGRELIKQEFIKNGGDSSHIDYHSKEWLDAVSTVMKTNSSLSQSISDLVKIRMGMTAIAGSELLKTKDEADKELREEIRFIESCFLDSPESAAKLTQLRIAKEINPEILAKYNVLKQVEPSRIYHKPVPHYELSVPNRVRDLTDYWQCLYENDPTVPALKTYLLHEGERLWQEILVKSNNHPSLVSLNNHLSLYTNSCYLHRAETVFNDIEKYGQKPDRYSYQLMITMFAKSKHLKEASEYMRKMQLDGLTPSPETYGEMVLGLSRVGDVKTALAVMTDIEKQKLPKPNERYLKCLRQQLRKMGIEECPGMPKDTEKQRREEIRIAIRKQGKKSHSKVSYAFNANSF